MITTLVLAPQIADRLLELAKLSIESGGVLLVQPVADSGGNIRLLSRKLVEVPEDSYERRLPQELRVRSSGFVPPLNEAEGLGAIPIWIHTHPGNGCSPKMSRHDDKVNDELTDLFRLRADSDFYGALVVAHQDGNLTFTGHLDNGESTRPINRMISAGGRIAVAYNANSDQPALSDQYDRHVRAFGGGVQQIISDLRIAVVGCGGTGSAVAEQLVRLGARYIHLVDPDTLSLSNVTRVYGSTPGQVSRPKIDVVGDHLTAIAPDAKITRTNGVITDESIARLLCDADIIFGCTDDNAGRMILSKLPSIMLTPVIDCGVLLDSDSSGALIGINGRISVITPGSPCLLCIGRVDMNRARSELMSKAEHSARVKEGYAPALPGVEPAVVTFTTTVAAASVSELIERLVAYGPEPVPHEILLRLHEREMSTINYTPKSGHYCDMNAGKIGLGLTPRLLELTW